jgi:hypothetical protein
VIVDFKEAQRENPKWVIQHGLPEASGGSGLESVEDYPKYIWKDQSRSELHKTVSESIYDDNHLDAADMDDFIANDTFLSAVKYPVSEDEIDGRAFGDLEYVLLPDRVVGFDLHRRKYSILGLDHLQPVQTRKEGWADLKLHAGTSTWCRRRSKRISWKSDHASTLAEKGWTQTSSMEKVRV